MIFKRRKTRPSFGADGQRLDGAPRGLPSFLSTTNTTNNNTTTNNNNNSNNSNNNTSTAVVGQRPRPALGGVRSNSNRKLLGCRPQIGSSNRLFRTGQKLVVQNATFMPGLQCSTGGSGGGGLNKKFQRPMQSRRAYKGGADAALKRSSLGARQRTDGMARIFSRAGKGLNFQSSRVQRKEEDTDSCSNSEDEDEDPADEKPFEPLRVWQSPHQGGKPQGLPSQLVSAVQTDEYGVEETVTVVQAAPLQKYSKQDVFVPPVLAKWLRPHQREGVDFMYQCVMGMKEFAGNGCILADDMGLGKTLQSVTLIWTLLKTGITANGDPTAKRVIVVCPCSLVKNWDNEFVKWLGPNTVKTLAIAEGSRKEVERDLDSFVRTRLFNVLICSYECLRTHAKRLTKVADCCDLLVCDEAHRLKNNENQTSRALNSLPVKRRVLLTGTPMQNDLQEFYAMVDFTNPGVLGTQEEFRKKMLFPILRGREPDATEAQKKRMMDIQNDMSTIVNQFILRRINTLNAQHLPPKLVQVVCCNLTEIQQNMYQHLITSKDMHHVMEGKQVNCLGSIQMLMKLCNHPSLVAEEDGGNQPQKGRRKGTKQVKYNEDEPASSAAPGADGIVKFLPMSGGGGGRGNHNVPVHPEWSGKMFVLFRLMKEMRRPGNGNDKIVIVSNYTQTLDLIGRMCRQNSWGFCRLDGSITMKKRQKMVDEFNDPSSPLIAFLLSSKAGGCGLNLIGGNRLVLFDPDWNPAVDKQAAARCWRDGQKKRCFTYRFLATGTVEEKIFQRQLSKEGLQSVVDDKEQVNALSTKDLRNLFKLRNGTPSDTHDKLRCERCKIIHDNAESDALKVLPKKLAACLELIEEMTKHEDASHFLAPLNPEDHGVSKEAYEKAVKQPMDLGTVRNRLGMTQDQPNAYTSVSTVSKDVNRIFSNVVKVWSPGDAIADASRRLQTWWVEQWTELVPRLMIMKATEDQCPFANDAESDPFEGSAAINNERGDDYQEQIGMPDEENMRHWSHHHSADTVDDPVFRAAMRGSDAVSFVFGLEVTWSLIQQRQQEEEERQAMQELEAAEALQEDDENEDDEEPDSDSGAKTDHVDMNDKSEDNEMADVLNDETNLQHSEGPAEPKLVEQSTHVLSVDSPSSTIVATILSAEICTQDSSNNENCKPSVAEIATPSQTEWECSACHYFNQDSLKKCEMCTAKRQKKRSIEEVD
ncbi:unnamed protein product [Cylindrotheca closterium]|uniref:DNA repair and recombination protein RAD54-like n=1 Tax=Cylindrotheca closterium TaxID=2856 RepID=A0AAD2FZW3_9STRA|nr:unnamed protein product [Cylindrotheca closterium]